MDRSQVTAQPIVLRSQWMDVYYLAIYASRFYCPRSTNHHWVELLACFFANQQCQKMPPIEVAKENSA